MEKNITVGRRKTSVARVFLAHAPGDGSILVNKRSLEEYIPVKLLRDNALLPFTILELDPSDYKIRVNVHGGGISGQAEAIRLGIARALLQIDETYRPPLKAAGLLTRDSRMVERKKYGLHKARKAHQFSKR